MAANTAEIIATKTAQLNLWEDTDDNDVSFTSDAGVHLEEEETIIAKTINNHDSREPLHFV